MLTHKVTPEFTSEQRLLQTDAEDKKLVNKQKYLQQMKPMFKRIRDLHTRIMERSKGEFSLPQAPCNNPQTTREKD
jgi:phage host-nuclease inhibitor protein Gam